MLLVHADTNYRGTMSVEVQAGKTADVTLEWKKAEEMKSGRNHVSSKVNKETCRTKTVRLFS
jgi:major membrane immunogen (membrane-anchored lipoprotein)